MNEWSESMSVCLSRRDLTSFSQSMSPSRLWPRRLTNTHTHLRPASTDSPVQPGQAPTHKQKRPSPSHSTETKLQTQPAPAVCLSVCLSACVSRRWITSRCGSDRVEELVELEDVIGAAREQTHDGTLCVLHDFGEVGQRRGWTQRLYLPQPVDPDGSTAKELLKGTVSFVEGQSGEGLQTLFGGRIAAHCRIVPRGVVELQIQHQEMRDVDKNSGQGVLPGFTLLPPLLLVVAPRPVLRVASAVHPIRRARGVPCAPCGVVAI
mmetsp:Transcript_6470/g.18664  ORF Transcript_6470/g.18664 Transcript_6470/m.18664 type:complete len:264 (+) Transcript_6470:86-877(+)